MGNLNVESKFSLDMEKMTRETPAHFDEWNNRHQKLLSNDCYLHNEISVERSRVDNLATLKEGSTTGDAELADIRVGADGKTYPNAGEAVRGQISELKSDLSQLSEEIGNLERKNVTAQQWALLVSILRKGVFIDDESSNIDELESSYDRVPSTGIVLSSNSMSVTSSAPFKLMATVSPSDSTDVVKWTTSDPNVATVSNGTVTPVGDGTAVITAIAGDVSATCTLNVTFPVTYTVTSTLGDGLSFSNSAARVDENGSYTTEIIITGNYEISTVTVTMGGADVTSDVYADGTIMISSVTGDIVITATSIKVLAIVKDGLVNYFDFRDVTVQTGSGGLYYIPAATGEGILFAWSSISNGDSYGLPYKALYYSTDHTGTDAGFGDEFTVAMLGYGGGMALSNHASLSNMGTDLYYLRPKYKTDNGTVQLDIVSLVGTRSGYSYVVYSVSGTLLKVYVNGTLQHTFDGSDYSDFVSWVNNGLITGYTDGTKYTALAVYNKALTDTEIIDLQAYYQTLEVSA